jgi:uncharacterized YigZ family protein
MNLFFLPVLSMTDDNYRSLEKPAEGIFRDRNSRFLAFGFPVISVEEVNEILAGIRKKYHDARHHCYAYRLGHDKDIFRINDDGEPSGTAGKPIYGQLQSHDLTDTLVVVVRYFGGTLLGTSGLINAYRSATADMLSKATIVQKFKEDHFHLSFPYDKLNAVMKILKEQNVVPILPDIGITCSMDIKVRKSLSDRLKADLAPIPGLTMEYV